MNSPPPPAGPLSGPGCPFIKGQAGCVPAGAPTPSMSNWAREGAAAATGPPLFVRRRAAEPRSALCTHGPSGPARVAEPLCGKCHMQARLGPKGHGTAWRPPCPRPRHPEPPGTSPRPGQGRAPGVPATHLLWPRLWLGVGPGSTPPPTFPVAQPGSPLGRRRLSAGRPQPAPETGKLGRIDPPLFKQKLPARLRLKRRGCGAAGGSHLPPLLSLLPPFPAPLCPPLFPASQQTAARRGRAGLDPQAPAPRCRQARS